MMRDSQDGRVVFQEEIGRKTMLKGEQDEDEKRKEEREARGSTDPPACLTTRTEGAVDWRHYGILKDRAVSRYRVTSIR